MMTSNRFFNQERRLSGTRNRGYVESLDDWESEEGMNFSIQIDKTQKNQKRERR
jgi:uridine phosphorylase